MNPTRTQWAPPEYFLLPLHANNVEACNTYPEPSSQHRGVGSFLPNLPTGV